jgi:hypothetical protein
VLGRDKNRLPRRANMDTVTPRGGRIGSADPPGAICYGVAVLFACAIMDKVITYLIILCSELIPMKSCPVVGILAGILLTSICADVAALACAANPDD